MKEWEMEAYYTAMLCVAMCEPIHRAKRETVIRNLYQQMEDAMKYRPARDEVDNGRTEYITL